MIWNFIGMNFCYIALWLFTEVRLVAYLTRLIEFRGKKSLLDLVALELDLGKQYGRKVDVVTYNSLHPLLRDRILKDQHIIYGQGS